MHIIEKFYMERDIFLKYGLFVWGQIKMSFSNFEETTQLKNPYQDNFEAPRENTLHSILY